MKKENLTRRELLNLIMGLLLLQLILNINALLWVFFKLI